jgi:hypothetical protein
MSDPTVVSRESLSGTRVALSASESADLGRLGLSEYHCRLVIAELARALMLAGATVVYGGNLSRDGYTDILIEEAQRFGDNRQLLELVVPESEYRKHTVSQLRKIDDRLGEHGRLTLIRSDAEAVEFSEIQENIRDLVEPALALSAMRVFVSQNTDARVVVGGKLANYQGALPGVIEEAGLTLQAGKILLVAGGYGGAASAISSAINPSFSGSWQPHGFPQNGDDEKIQEALRSLADTYPTPAWGKGTAVELRKLLAVSHRPADISMCVVRLLDEASR